MASDVPVRFLDGAIMHPVGCHIAPMPSHANKQGIARTVATGPPGHQRLSVEGPSRRLVDPYRPRRT